MERGVVVVPCNSSFSGFPICLRICFVGSSSCVMCHHLSSVLVRPSAWSLPVRENGGAPGFSVQEEWKRDHPPIRNSIISRVSDRFLRRPCEKNTCDL